MFTLMLKKIMPCAEIPEALKPLTNTESSFWTFVICVYN